MRSTSSPVPTSPPPHDDRRRLRRHRADTLAPMAPMRAQGRICTRRRSAGDIEDGADRRRDRDQRRQPDRHSVGAGDVHQLVDWISSVAGAGPARAVGCRHHLRSCPGASQFRPALPAHKGSEGGAAQNGQRY